MLIIDKYKCILDNHSKDGGDSARANGLFELYNRGPQTLELCAFVSPEGLGVRHPYMVPWNNPNNFTWDQLVCLSAGLYRRGYLYAAERLFISQKDRKYFCQNIERDYPESFTSDLKGGTVRYPSTKKPYPHHFTELVGDARVEGFSYFDYRDPRFSPDDIWHLRLCAGYESGLTFKTAAQFLLKKKIEVFAQTPIGQEPNQIMAKVKIAGPEFVALFKLLVPNWEVRVGNYWTIERDCWEMSKIIVEGF